MPSATDDHTPVLAQPQQLTLRYAGPTRELTISLSLTGLLVLAEAPGGSEDDLVSYLGSCGVGVLVDDMHGVHFPVKDLHHLRHLPAQVTVVSDQSMRALLAVLVERVDDGLPITVTANPDDSLELGWYQGGVEHTAALSTDAAVAFLQSNVTFSATTEAWRFLSRNSSLPVEVGVASASLNGTIEIESTKPQLLEQIPPTVLRTLYAIGASTFGVPVAFVDDVLAAPGITWSGPEPIVETAPDGFDEVPIALSQHSRQDLGALVADLAQRRAQAVVWDSGLGRRVFALAAVTVLEAWPLLIVAPPSSVWVWQRHLDLLGRRGSLRHGRVDVHLVTYSDLAKRHVPLAPASIIFDGLASEPSARRPDVVKALHRLDGILHAYRLVIDASWPDDLDESTRLLSLLRPGEFRHDVPASLRYPIYTEPRGRAHEALYVSRRTYGETVEHLDGSSIDTSGATAHHFRRSSVLVLDVSEAQQLALEEVRAHAESASHVLAESLEIVSGGTSAAIGPKVTAVVRMLLDDRGSSTTAVVTRFDRTAVLLARLLRPIGATIVTTPVADPERRVQIVVANGPIPPLLGFSHVIIVDYPWSFTAIERAVGSAASLDGPRRVTCVHLRDTVDDRLAMLAARRRELDGTQSLIAPPDFVEIDYLLAGG